MMGDEKTENKIIEHLSGSLSIEEQLALESEISKSKELQIQLSDFEQVYTAMDNVQMKEVPSRIKSRFNQFLLNEIALEGKKVSSIKTKKLGVSRIKKLSILGLFSTLVLIISILLYQNVMHDTNHNMSEQFAVLRLEMLQLLEEERSTSGRIKAVNISYEIPNPDEEIMDALILAMKTDQSDNVRLSAVEALYDNYANSPKVRSAFCKALNQQENPMIQSRIIEILVGYNEKQYGKYLEEFINVNSALPKIKDEAHLGIMKIM